MDQTKLGVGTILLAISSTVFFGATDLGSSIQTLLAGGAALGLLTGSVLIGTDRSRRLA
jgi:hypothetical protein